MPEDTLPPPSRKMQRDMGILHPRIFSLFDKKYGAALSEDEISLVTYKEMLKDSQVRAGLDVMVLATIGSGWEFNYRKLENRNEEVLDFIRGVYGNINAQDGVKTDLFQVFTEVLTAIWAGFSVTEKVWGRDGEGRWIIKRYKVLPPDTIKFNINKQGILSPSEAVQQGYSVVEDIKLPARKVNIFRLNSRFGNPWGESALRAIYKNWYVKDWLVKFHSSYLENLGSPLLVGQTTRDTKIMSDALLDARNSSVITLGDGESVEILESGRDGSSFQNAIHYHDVQILRGMLVPSLLIGQDEQVGSRALSEVHYEMFKLSRIGALQTQLSSWINTDVREMIRLNFGDQEVYPEITFKSWSRSDQQRTANMIVDLIGANVIIPREKWIREFLELPELDKDIDPDELLPKPEQEPEARTPNPEDREVPPGEVREPGEDASRVQQEDVPDIIPIHRALLWSTKESQFPIVLCDDGHSDLGIILRARGGRAMSKTEAMILTQREELLSNEELDDTVRRFWHG